MKILKELSNMHNIFVDSINELDSKLQEQEKNIKKEYQKNVYDEKNKLLLAICKGENMDFDIMKKKYIKKNEPPKPVINTIVESVLEENELLDKIEINKIEYYYENKNNGKIYNLDSIIVGVYKNNQHSLF
jgi:hypothetical protein